MFIEHGADEDLRPRFKRRDQSRHNTKYIPQRLKLSANSEVSCSNVFIEYIVFLTLKCFS